MAKQNSDPLFMLINSLTKAEKRHFRLRYDTDKDSPLFMQLFDILDRSSQYDEKTLLSKLPAVKKRQLANLKTNLNDHILESLRWLSRDKDIRIHIRRLIDYAQVLYNKGLYRQSLKLLNKAKLKAKNHQEIELRTEIIEFEKIIEGRHITRSLENRAETLSEEAKVAIQQFSNLSHLSNLALNLYGMYLKMGHVKNEKEAMMLRTFFEHNLYSNDLGNINFQKKQAITGISHLSFYEKINLYQAYSWYAHILQDFLLYYRYSQKWVDLFDEYPQQKQSDPSLYLKALNNVLTAHFFNLNYPKFQRDLERIATFWQDHEKEFNENTTTLAFVYTYTAKFNKYFLEGTFDEGLRIIPQFLNQLEQRKTHLDHYRILVFYYKIACLYFGSGENKRALTYLNKIINWKIGDLRPDLQCFAQILHLIAHYELKHYDLIDYLVPTVHNFLEKHQELSAVLKEILKFLRTFDPSTLRGLRESFIELKDRLESVAEDPYERRFFLYLDVISWLESKIEGRPVQEVIQEKFKKGEARV